MTRTFLNIDAALPALASEIMSGGVEMGSRLGERTMELLHEQIVLEKPWMREVLVEDRRANVVTQIAETMWVLAGRNDVEWLGHYLPRAKDFSDDGKVWRGGYGPRLRAWDGGLLDSDIDQIRHIVDLLNEDRTSRRAVVSIYNPAVDTAPGKDIPCNDFLSFISRNGRLDLSVFVRSNDLIWGWSGINAFEWSTLQEIVAGILGLKVGHLVFNTTSLHIYDRHWAKAGRLSEAPLASLFADSPRFSGSAVHNYGPSDQHPIERLDALVARWFRVEERLRTGKRTHPDDVINFPEPMMRSWLEVIAWYWTGDEEYLTRLKGTRLFAAVQMSPKSVWEHAEGQKGERPELGILAIVERADREARVGDTVKVYPVTLDATPTPSLPPLTFIEYVDNLHREKGAAYGGSWKKRGEQMSILANIARKIDRLEGGVETSDETQADTAIDLLVYLIKYRLWLSETNPNLSLPMLNTGDEYGDLRAMLEWLAQVAPKGADQGMVARGVEAVLALFSQLEGVVTDDPHREEDSERAGILANLLLPAFMVARTRWEGAHGEPDYQNPYRNIDA